MAAKFLGIQNIGPKSGDVSASFAMAGAGAATVSPPDTIAVPTIPYVIGILGGGGSQVFPTYYLNPSNVQGNANFGTVLGMQVSINRSLQWFVSSSSCFIPGRVFIQVSGQIFVFAPKTMLNFVPTSELPAQWAFESDNTLIPVWSQGNANINVFMEPDFINGSVSLNPSTLLYITLFNFDIRTPGKV